MDPETIAALVKAATPDHVPHMQDFLSYDGIERKVNLSCSCGVGLTIDVPATPQPSKTKAQPQQDTKGGSYGA